MKSSLKPGEKIEAPVELRDLLPTFLALNGCRIPEEIDGLSLLPLLEKGKAPWREYIDIEHSTAYWADNYWCALTDGKIKYIWFFRTGEEQLFDLSKDPYELHDLSKAKASGKTLEKMRKAMAGHLQERGEEWVKDGKLVIRNKNLLYSPNYPSSVVRNLFLGHSPLHANRYLHALHCAGRASLFCSPNLLCLSPYIISISDFS